SVAPETRSAPSGGTPTQVVPTRFAPFGADSSKVIRTTPLTAFTLGMRTLDNLTSKSTHFGSGHLMVVSGFLRPTTSALSGLIGLPFLSLAWMCKWISAAPTFPVRPSFVSGVTCCPALTLKMQAQVTAALRPAYEELAAALPAQPHLGIDESPTKEAATKAWLWTFVAGLFTVFAVRGTRAATALTDLLSDTFTGIVVCD